MNIHDSVNTTQIRQSGCCCVSKSATTTQATNASDLPTQYFQVQGATCGGCVRSIEQTLQSVTGVTNVQMDLASGIASVTGTVPPSELIAALKRVSFPATFIN